MASNGYTKAKKRAEKAYRRALAQGQYPFLPALDEMVPDAQRLRQERVGICEIPVELIAGTVSIGRRESFAANFMPMLPVDSEFALKWSSLLDYQEAQGILDPVKVYEFLGKFYVLEGNKRVSVMKYLGNPDIPADVTRLHPPRREHEASQAYREFLRFFRCTKQYAPMLSQKGAYERLARYFDQSLEHPWQSRQVQRLRASYYRFAREYAAQGGSTLPLPTGDAFLLFLDVYGGQPLGPGAEEDLRKKLKGFWEEYLVQSNQQPIAFSRLPNVRRPRSPLKKIWNRAAGYSPLRPLTIAFIYDGDPACSRWLNGHEEGRQTLEKEMGGAVRTLVYPSCDSAEKFMQAVSLAAGAGAKIIFSASPVQMADTLRAAMAHPHIRFLNCSVHLPHSAVRSYYGRMYEVKFLLGAVAAALAEDHRIGYISGVPLYGTVANINAFAIGASMIDPKVQVHLVWSCLQDHSWRDEVHRKGLTIVSGPDLIRPGRDDREYGLYRYDAEGSITALARPLWNWGRFYEIMTRTAMTGGWEQEAALAREQALNYWWGMSSGIIDISISASVPQSTRHMIDGMRKALMAGLLGPFEGELVSQQGPVRTAPEGTVSAQADSAEGPAASARENGAFQIVRSAGAKVLQPLQAEVKTEADVGLPPEDIITMDWLQERVIGRLPEWEELTPSAQKAVSAGGIVEAVKR